MAGKRTRPRKIGRWRCCGLNRVRGDLAEDLD
jgi:hypothetical protein